MRYAVTLYRRTWMGQDRNGRRDGCQEVLFDAPDFVAAHAHIYGADGASRHGYEVVSPIVAYTGTLTDIMTLETQRWREGERVRDDDEAS